MHLTLSDGGLPTPASPHLPFRRTGTLLLLLRSPPTRAAPCHHHSAAVRALQITLLRLFHHIHLSRRSSEIGAAPHCVSSFTNSCLPVWDTRRRSQFGLCKSGIGTEEPELHVGVLLLNVQREKNFLLTAFASVHLQVESGTCKPIAGVGEKGFLLWPYYNLKKMTGNMEENWREKLWERSRDRIAETYRHASSVDIEAFLGSSIIGHVGKDMLNRAKRKYEWKNSLKPIKLRQFVTRLRMGRLGYLFLVFAALGTLAVPLMFQDRLPQQLDQEFERAMNIQLQTERGMDDSFTRSIKENLRNEEGKASLDMSGRKPEVTTGVSDKGENVEDAIFSEGETAAVLTSEDVKLPDLVQWWKKSDQLEGESSESHDVAAIRKSDISVSEERTDTHQIATPSTPSSLKSHKFKRRSKLDPFHALVASAEMVSSNVAPPVAHSTVDTVGSSNEAFEEVPKLASDANKTAGEKPVELQEESSMAELLPNDKPAELDVSSQKLSRDKNESSKNKDTIASNMGLASEEQKRDTTVGGDNDAFREITGNTHRTDSTLSREEESASDVSTAVADETKTVANETKAVVDETKVVANETKAVYDETKVDETKAVANETKAVVDETKVDETKAVADESKGVADETKAVANETEAVFDETTAVPQDSAITTLLRQRAASGTLKVGLLNIEATDLQGWRFLAGGLPTIIPLERVNETVQWNDLYKEWIDEEEKYGTPECPSLPMPKVSSEVKLDVVIVRAPCDASSVLQEGWKHPASLQVLLGAASLSVKAGNENTYVLIISECRPLVNLFTCGELLEHRDQGWLYQVNLKQLEQRISLPVGSCELSVPLRRQETSIDLGARKDAYVTVLHSGEDYVCGAIATAHSIRKTGSTKDLVVLIDSSILPEHRQALKEAGWQLRDFERIYKSNSVEGKQDEKDFSKFRLWQLTDYNKVVYIEADVLVLRNLDHLFMTPEVSGSGSTRTLFNSGVMVIEPSNCTFQFLMDEMEKVGSEIGDDWDFLNRMFPWWHRIPRHMNYLKYFWTRQNNEDAGMNRLFSSDPPQLYAIHYRGYKPWQCFRDYDCNWNVNQEYASDEAHNQWFKVYDDMPRSLQKHCALSTATKAFLEHNRRAAEAAISPDEHWAVNITDTRLNECQEIHCDWNALLSQWDKTTSTAR